MTSNYHHERRSHGPAARMALICVLVLLGTAALVWGWNSLAADLFAAPRAQFRHALAFELVIAVISATGYAVVRTLSRRTDPSS